MGGGRARVHWRLGSWLACVALAAAASGCTSGAGASDVHGVDMRRDSAPDAPRDAIADGVDASADLPSDGGLDGDASSIGCSIAAQPIGTGSQYSVTVSVRGVSVGDVTLERNPGGSAGSQPIVNGVAAFAPVDVQLGTVTLTATVSDSSKAEITRCQHTLSNSTSIPPCVISFQPPPMSFGGHLILPAGVVDITVTTVPGHVELFVDGQSQGVKATVMGHALWTTALAPGSITIEAVCTASLGGVGQSKLVVLVE